MFGPVEFVDVFGVDCFCSVVCSDLRVKVSARSICVCVRLPAPVSVLLELGVHLVARARPRVPYKASRLMRLAVSTSSSLWRLL